MQILTADVFKIVTDRANITVAIKYKIVYRFSINIFRFDLSPLKVKAKIMHISTANISKIVTDWASITITNKYEVAYGFLIGIFQIDLGPC